MPRRPPADADEDTLIMPRPAGKSRGGRPAAARPARGKRPPRRSPLWLVFVLVVALLGGAASWMLYGNKPPAPPVAAVAPPAQAVVEVPPPAQPAPSAGQTPPAAPEPPTQPQPTPRIVEARLAEIDGLRHAGTVVYRLAENPRILLIDFPTLADQGRAMNRLAALIEKSGMPHDRVLSEAEMAVAIANPDTYYFAHDYTATSLARFFSLAEAETQPLNEQERDLLALLTGARVIARGASGYVATTPEMAVVTLVQPENGTAAVGQTVDAALRDTMLHHEVSHGEFFTNPAYRAHCERFWRERLSDAERALFRGFLKSFGYDPGDETLMINEMQAYLMHTPDARAFSAGLLKVTPEQLADLRRRFMDPQPPTPLLGGKAPAGG